MPKYSILITDHSSLNPLMLMDQVNIDGLTAAKKLAVDFLRDKGSRHIPRKIDWFVAGKNQYLNYKHGSIAIQIYRMLPLAR